MSIWTTVWAMNAEGLNPASKLVLILASDAADMDDRVFNVEEVRVRANLTQEGFDLAMQELATVGLAIMATGVEPGTGARGPCIVLMASEAAI